MGLHRGAVGGHEGVRFFQAAALPWRQGEDDTPRADAYGVVLGIARLQLAFLRLLRQLHAPAERWHAPAVQVLDVSQLALRRARRGQDRLSERVACQQPGDEGEDRQRLYRREEDIADREPDAVAKLQLRGRLAPVLRP